MKLPKNLDMDKVNELFDKHFEVDKAELEKGITMWTFTPKREVNTVEEAVQKHCADNGIEYVEVNSDAEHIKELTK